MSDFVAYYALPVPLNSRLPTNLPAAPRTHTAISIISHTPSKYCEKIGRELLSLPQSSPLEHICGLLAHESPASGVSGCFHLPVINYKGVHSPNSVSRRGCLDTGRSTDVSSRGEDVLFPFARMASRDFLGGC